MRVIIHLTKLYRPFCFPRNWKLIHIKLLYYRLYVLHGCKTWCLMLREEHRLRVFENKVLRKIFGTKRNEITGNGESYIIMSYTHCILRLTLLPILNQDDWDGQDMEQFRNAYRILVGKPESKRPLGTPRLRWENNIKINLQDMDFGTRNWMILAHNRDRWRASVREVMNLHFP